MQVQRHRWTLRAHLAGQELDIQPLRGRMRLHVCRRRKMKGEAQNRVHLSRSGLHAA